MVFPAGSAAFGHDPAMMASPWLSASCPVMTESAFFCPLVHEGLLAVRGPEAGTFLQGQLTCNLQYLDASHSSPGARCTPKGRMLSSFRILPEGDGYLLAMAAELLEPQQADLKKYAVFSKAVLSDESPHWLRLGLYQAGAALAAMGLPLPEQDNQMTAIEGGLLVRLSASRSELWLKRSSAESLGSQLAARLPEAPLNDWLLAQIRDGAGQVFGPTRELFVPQMINLQALGGVSFKKGCYAGQEIVARTQYLGKLKRRLYRLQLDSMEVPAPATALFSPAHPGGSAGEVVLAARTAEGGELLAVVQEEAIADGRLQLGTPEGPRLQPMTLPYELDPQQELQR